MVTESGIGSSDQIKEVSASESFETTEQPIQVEKTPLVIEQAESIVEAAQSIPKTTGEERVENQVPSPATEATSTPATPQVQLVEAKADVFDKKTNIFSAFIGKIRDRIFPPIPKDEENKVTDPAKRALLLGLAGGAGLALVGCGTNIPKEFSTKPLSDLGERVTLPPKGNRIIDRQEYKDKPPLYNKVVVTRCKTEEFDIPAETVIRSSPSGERDNNILSPADYLAKIKLGKKIVGIALITGNVYVSDKPLETLIDQENELKKGLISVGERQHQLDYDKSNLGNVYIDGNNYGIWVEVTINTGKLNEEGKEILEPIYFSCNFPVRKAIKPEYK